MPAEPVYIVAPLGTANQTFVPQGALNVSLSAQSALNTQGSTADNGVARANHSLFVVTSAGVSAGVVTLMGSNDNVNWFATACTVTTNAASSAFAANLQNFPYRYVAAKITTGIIGGTVTATTASC